MTKTFFILFFPNEDYFMSCFLLFRLDVHRHLAARAKTTLFQVIKYLSLIFGADKVLFHRLYKPDMLQAAISNIGTNSTN